MRLLDDDCTSKIEAAARELRREVWADRDEWQWLDLTTGVVGLGMFASALAQTVDDASRLLDSVLARAIELFDAHGAGPSLHDGIAGLGLWLSQTFDCPELLESIDVALIADVERKPPLLSLRAGLAGIAVYAATRSSTRTGRELGADIARVLAERAWFDSRGLTWLVPRDYARDRGLDMSDGPIFEPGMAHGHAGIVVGLASLAQAGNKTAAELVLPALDWLWAVARPPPNRYAWVVAGDESVELNVNTWCTGDPGVARAAWLAARAVDHDGHAARALELARSLADEALVGARAGLADRCDLCCGAAAIGHIFHRFFEETGEVRFRDAAVATLAPLVAELPRVAGYSFQFGRAGIVTALVSATTDVQLDWDVAFGMSLP